MKIFTDFALKERYKLLQLIGDKLVEIDSLIDWKTVSIIFESMYFNK
jgi:IS5 family transposase